MPLPVKIRPSQSSIEAHAATVEADIALAMTQHGIAAAWTAKSLALHTQAVLQGSFVLAKAQGGPRVAIDSVDHLRRYIEFLFGRVPSDPSPNQGDQP